VPTYEYQCDSCRVRFERRQRMSDEPVKECPECGGSVRRLLFPVGIVFKGSGFYITDHGRNGGNGGHKSASESSSEEKKVEKVEAAKTNTESVGSAKASTAAQDKE